MCICILELCAYFFCVCEDVSPNSFCDDSSALVVDTGSSWRLWLFCFIALVLLHEILLSIRSHGLSGRYVIMCCMSAVFHVALACLSQEGWRLISKWKVRFLFLEVFALLAFFREVFVFCTSCLPGCAEEVEGAFVYAACVLCFMLKFTFHVNFCVRRCKLDLDATPGLVVPGTWRAHNSRMLILSSWFLRL